MSLVFTDWDWRPAVLTPSGKAFAVLGPGKGWTAVDESDVSNSAAVMSEVDWRATFEGTFGPLDLSAIPGQA